MKLKCFACDSKVEYKKSTVQTGWGDYKLKVTSVGTYVCVECGEIIIAGRNSLILQKFGKGMSELDKESRLREIDFDDILNFINMNYKKS